MKKKIRIKKHSFVFFNLTIFFLNTILMAETPVASPSPSAAQLQQQSKQMESSNQSGNIGKVTSIAQQQIAKQGPVGGASGAESSSGSGSSSGAKSSLGNSFAAAENAGQASSDQSQGKVMNYVMSAAMAGLGGYLAYEASACSAEAPGCPPPLIAMSAFAFLQAAMGIMQAANQDGTSGANHNAANDFMSSDPNTLKSLQGAGSTSGTGADGSKNELIGAKGNLKTSTDPYKNLPDSAKATLAKMTDLGYKVDLKNQTFTTPDGHSISAKEASSNSNIDSKLGLPAGTAEKGMAMVDEIAKRNANGGDGSANSVAGSGGGDGGAAGDGSGLAQGEAYDGSGGKNDKNGKNNGIGARLPASALVAGLTSKYNGELIGVSSDDIFKMVTRRYQLKHDQDSFLTIERPGKGILGEPIKK